MTRILATALQELRIARRNRWALLATVLFTAFALALALFAIGQRGQVKADTLTLTAASLATLSVYLIPLIALLISYDALAGEMERGTLALALATPLSPGEIYLAKALAQTAVVGGAILAGFSVAALATIAFEGLSAEGLAAWLRLTLTSVALGAIFVALGILVSALASRTAAAAALAVGLWLAAVVLYDIALLGALMASGDGVFSRQVFPWLVLANPADAFRLYNLVLLPAAPVAGLDGLARHLPVPAVAALVPLGIWLVAALAGGMFLTRRVRP